MEEQSVINTYRSFRRFPELQASYREISQNVESLKSAAKIQRRATLHTLSSLPTSAIAVKELTRSALPEINQLSKFRNDVLSNHFKRRNSQGVGVIGSSTRLHEKNTDTAPAKVPADCLSSAEDKLTKHLLASSKDLSSTGAMAAFDDKNVTREIFHILLKQSLRLYLTPGEEIALFRMLDPARRGCIDGRAFYLYYLKLGSEAKRRLRDELNSQLHQIESQRNDEQRLLKEKRRSLEIEQLSFAYTDEDRQRIETRLHEAALLTEAHCDWSRFGFGSILSPFEFKTHVEKVFRWKLTAAEAGALVDIFRPRAAPDNDIGDGTYDGHVDGVAFGKRMQRMRSEALDKRASEHRSTTSRLLAEKKLGPFAFVESYTQALGR